MRVTQHVVVALTVGGAALLSIGTASAAASSTSAHTLRFTSTTTTMTQFGPRFVSADSDVKGSHVIGADVLSGKVTYTKKVHSVAGSIAIALEGGEIYATFTGNPDTNTLIGTLTGGAGDYEGISGKISGRPLKGSSDEAIVVSYH